jgi:hypothetical protein
VALRREQWEEFTMRIEQQGRKVRPITHVTSTALGKEMVVHLRLE